MEHLVKTSQGVVGNVSAKWLSQFTLMSYGISRTPKPAFTRYPLLVIAGRDFLMASEEMR